MPWETKDVNGFFKGLSDKGKEVWVSTANSVLSECIKAGGTDKSCAPKAVRIANKAAGKYKESEDRPDPALYKIREVDNTREAKQMEEMVKRTLHKLVEVGRTISAANEKKLRVAVAQVQEILASLDSGITEAERFVLQEANNLIEAESFDETRNKIRTALKAQLGAQDIYVRDIYPDSVVYEGPSAGGMILGTGKLYQVDYSIDDAGAVTFGTPEEVCQKQTYEAVVAEAAKPKEEPMEKLQEFVPLTEAKSVDGAIPIKIIAPGWGNSGFYSPEVLKAAAQIYKVGTHSYWNHPSVSEEADRPERSLKDLAGVLSKPATYQEDGVWGPGLYSAVKPFSGYEKVIKEMAAHIGMSHRALGKATKGEMAGRAGNIIESIVKVDSVDFVTHPGAGGQIVQMFEAARGSGVDFVLLDETKHKEEVERMADNEKIEGLEKENATLKAGNILREGTALVTKLVTESKLPEASKTRLLESLPGKTVQKDGALDTEESSKVISEAINAEQAYVTALLPAGPGVIGLGEGKPAGETDPEAGKTALKESFKATYMSQGKTAEEATRLAEIAAKGR